MATWRVNNSTALGGEVCSPWQAAHAYSLGARCVCTTAAATARRAYVYECTTAGTSHATTQPVWPTSGTIADGAGALVWTTRNPNDGNWDNASCFIHYVSYHAATAAGDFVYVDDSHNETLTIAIIAEGSTVKENPIKYICVDKASDALSTGAIAYGSHATVQTTFSGYGYSYGITWKALAGITIAAGWTFESNGGNVLSCNKTTVDMISIDGHVKIINGNIVLSDADLYINFADGVLEWYGGSLTAAAGINTLFHSPSTPGLAYIYGVDLSAIGNGGTKTLFDASGTSVGCRNVITCMYCKLPAAATSWKVCDTWNGEGLSRIMLHSCSDENRTYDFYEETCEGILQDNTSIYANAGSITPDSTNYSMSMVTVAGTLDSYVPFDSMPIALWTNSTSAKTFTIEGVWDSAANIEDDEIWAVFVAPSSNASGLGQVVSTRCALLGTPADVPASTATWTGTGGFANENKFKIQATITPGKVGPITARVYLAKENTTVYIDAKITES